MRFHKLKNKSVSIQVKISSLLKKYAPSVIEYGRGIKKIFKKQALQKKRRNNQIITKEQLVADLIKIGIQQGDNVIVHSSLSKIGCVEEGAKTFVDAILEVIGTEGTLLCPCFAHSTFGKYYLDSDPVFDVNNSPSKAGAITEYVRKLKGTRRSLHPTDSACAYGPLADYFINSHFGQLTPYNQFSPYYKLTEKKGKILNVGVPLNTSCTNMHTLEDSVDFIFPIYHSKIYEVKMIDEKGIEQTMKTKVHDPVFSAKRKPNDLEPLFEKEGILTRGTVGETFATLIDAKGLLDVMIKNYNERGVTMYTPFGTDHKPQTTNK
jgi:aminoglycoside 3-N-acetyltransferase